MLLLLLLVMVFASFYHCKHIWTGLHVTLYTASSSSSSSSIAVFYHFLCKGHTLVGLLFSLLVCFSIFPHMKCEYYNNIAIWPVEKLAKKILTVVWRLCNLFGLKCFSNIVGINVNHSGKKNFSWTIVEI